MAVPEQDSNVAQVRAEFEEHLGRQLSESEWRALTDHAHRHCDTVLRPAWGKGK